MEIKTYKTERGSNLSYYEVGDGEKIIVFIHGQQTSSESYFEVVKELKDKYKLILVDCYGHGKSEHDASLYKLDVIGDDINELIELITKEKVALIGHSSGGLIAAYIAGNYDSCDRLILEDPPFFSSSNEERFTSFNYIDLATICHNFLAQEKEKDFVLYYFKKQYIWNLLPKFVSIFLKGSLIREAEKFRKEHPEKTLQVKHWPENAFLGMNDYDPKFGETFYTNSFHSHIDYEELLRNIRCKTLFMKAKTDRSMDGILLCALSEEDLNRVLSLVPNCELVRFDSGHGIHDEKKEEFICTLHDYL